MERRGRFASSVIMRIELARGNSLLTKESKLLTKQLKTTPKNNTKLKINHER